MKRKKDGAKVKRFLRAVLPAFLLAVSVGQIYAFTNFSDEIAQTIAPYCLKVQPIETSEYFE